VTAPRRQRGNALLLALIVLVLVESALVLLAMALRLRQEEARREARDVRLLALADAAVARSLACLASAVGCGGFPEEQLGPGRIAAEIASDGGTRRRILARARWGAAALAVEADVQLTPGGPQVVRWRRAPAGPDTAAGERD
jgi:hypothetical protein